MLTQGPFKFGLVDSEEVRKAIHRLRYKIYVEEFCFEKPGDHPGGVEMDEYDPVSIHFAAMDSDDEVIGTIRMILDSKKGFPIEHAARLNFNGLKPPPPERTSEISRLAVSKTYRRRQEDGIFGVESYLKKSEGGILANDGRPDKEQKQRERPMIVLGLYQAMYHEAKRRGITHLYMITEQKLFYALRHFGIYFKQIGDPVEYHGLRVPYIGIVAEMEKKLKEFHPKTLSMLLTGLEPQYHPN
ncbi:MAG: long-chain N-acyl amino acid synthase [Deltaproteobacteria bacterium RBG_13_49_15]|nr:MAG: long-chain N-acyl amino acid synthase [Deltaproteobacteria bacterium RBG_13_49_15]